MKQRVKPKVKSKAKLRKEADSIFSRYIRQRDKGVCFTCGRQADWKSMQNGHFVPRQYLSTRYAEDNCACQCYACNILYNGQPSVFALRLEGLYGKGHIEMLEKKRQEINRYFDYEAVIRKYTEKCKELNYEI